MAQKSDMAPKSKKGTTPKGFAEEQQAAFDASAVVDLEAMPRRKPERRLLKIGSDGRVLIPADWRQAMVLEENDTLVAHLQDGELTLHGSQVGLRKARAILRRHVGEGVSLVDELLEERRREAAAEADGGKSQ